VSPPPRSKARSWAYEREWRCFHAEASTLFTYPAEALKAVYFGPNVDRFALDIVCIILAGQNPDVELWVGKRSESEFKVSNSRLAVFALKTRLF